MKIDLSPEAIAQRLKTVNELRRTCLSLAKSSAGKTHTGHCAGVTVFPPFSEGKTFLVSRIP